MFICCTQNCANTVDVCSFTCTQAPHHGPLPDINMCFCFISPARLVFSIHILLFSFPISFCFMQRLRYSTFSAGRTSTPESLSKHILRRGHVFNSRLRRFRSRYLAVSVVYGYHDLCSAYRITDTGNNFPSLFRSLDTLCV